MSQLARLAGVAPDTVRYYGRIGLLPERERSEAGYRRFDAGQADRIRFIRAAQRLGLRLAEVGEQLQISRERVRQIQMKTLNLLREQRRTQNLREYLK